jgi:hypothetical protein
MIARITIVAVAIALLGLVRDTAQAQGSPQYATAAAGLVGGDQGCADPACTSCADTGAPDEWVSTKRFGFQHHPNCSCPRCHPRHAWASFDALMWWGKGRSMPPLVTSGADGVLPSAPILFGGGTVGSEMAAGARADFGFWFDDCETLGMGVKVWGLEGDSDGFYRASELDGNPVLARPFWNINEGVDGAEDALRAASPGLLEGSINVDTSSSVLAAEAYLRSGVLAGRGYNVDLIGGYHFLQLDDELSVLSNSRVIEVGIVPIGTILDVFDNFDARNEFHGGTVGIVSEVRRGSWTLSSLAKFSVGNMHQSVRIAGYQSVTAPTELPVVTPGGVFAQPTNMGTYDRNVTAWIPEFGVTAGYDVRSWLRLTAGYNILWISNVALAGDQIDRGVNPQQDPLIGPARPAFGGFQETEYWLQGLSLGAVLMY